MTLLYLFALLQCDRGGCDRQNVAEAVAVKQDCPPGVTRCVGGAVEVAEGHTACPGCPCAWKRIDVCERGCVAENVELVRDIDQAKTLCVRSGAATPPGADAGAPLTCSGDERFVCHLGTVYACPPGGSAVPVGVCTSGCVTDGEALDDPAIDVAAANGLLCGWPHDP